MLFENSEITFLIELSLYQSDHSIIAVLKIDFSYDMVNNYWNTRKSIFTIVLHNDCIKWKPFNFATFLSSAQVLPCRMMFLTPHEKQGHLIYESYHGLTEWQKRVTEPRAEP